MKDDVITQLKTVRDFVRYGASLFNTAQLYYGHGTDNAWDDALALVLHALHFEHEFADKIAECRLANAEKQLILELFLKRSAMRLPVPYITNKAFFAGLEFYVDERVLIPRSPIAELIEDRFQPWIQEENVHAILDLCTGSGCIAIACAHAFPDAQIWGSDISEGALKVAMKNCARYQLESQVDFLQSDVFENFADQKFDIIVANPPYVDALDMTTLPDEYRHEPRQALEAGEDGLDIVRKILQDAGKHLNPRGILVVEVGNSAQALSAEYSHLPFTWLDFSRGEAEVFLLPKETL